MKIQNEMLLCMCNLKNILKWAVYIQQPEKYDGYAPPAHAEGCQLSSRARKDLSVVHVTMTVKLADQFCTSAASLLHHIFWLERASSTASAAGFLKTIANNKQPTMGETSVRKLMLTNKPKKKTAASGLGQLKRFSHLHTLYCTTPVEWAGTSPAAGHTWKSKNRPVPRPPRRARRFAWYIT